MDRASYAGRDPADRRRIKRGAARRTIAANPSKPRHDRALVGLGVPFDPPAPAGAFALVATRRFSREASAFRRKYPAFGEALKAFCRFRAEAAPTEPYNTKDGRMAGPLSHLRRCHLVHGKAVAIYATVGRVMRLIALVEHDGLEGKAVPEIAAYARALGVGDFEPAMDLLDDPELVELRAEVARLRARAEADAASLRRLERECADAWVGFPRSRGRFEGLGSYGCVVNSGACSSS